MSVFQVTSRVLMFAVTALVCVWLTSRFGPLTAMGIWAVAIAVVCGGTALVMHSQKPGKITPINYLAGIVLPLGYKVGRGKLPPIIIASWLGWVVAGLAVVVLRWRATGNIVPWLLYASWIIAGIVLLRLAGIIVMRANSNPIPSSLFTPIVVLGALLIGSLAMVLFGRGEIWSYIALLLVGGPIAVVGGGYLLWLGVMLTFGRHARWN